MVTGQQVVGGKPGDARRWIENPEAVGLEFLGRAHEVKARGDTYTPPRRFDATGWWVDDHCEEVVSGVVYKLPGGRGFLYGTEDPYNCDSYGEGPAWLVMEPATDLDDAVRWARSEGERQAEEYRRGNRQAEAEHRAEEVRAEASELRRSLLVLLRERKSMSAEAVAELRKIAGRMCAQLEGLRQEVARLKDIEETGYGQVYP